MEKNSVTINAIDIWNKVKTSLGDTIFKGLTTNNTETTIMERMIDSC